MEGKNPQEEKAFILGYARALKETAEIIITRLEQVKTEMEKLNEKEKPKNDD